MSFKVFNKDSIIITAYEGRIGSYDYIDGIVLDKEEVNHLLRNLGNIITAIKTVDVNKRIRILTKDLEAKMCLEGECLLKCDVSYRDFSKAELTEFINAIPELIRWLSL